MPCKQITITGCACTHRIINICAQKITNNYFPPLSSSHFGKKTLFRWTANLPNSLRHIHEYVALIELLHVLLDLLQDLFGSLLPAKNGAQNRFD